MRGVAYKGIWGCIRALAYGRKPGRCALSNLYITNPNPDLPPVLCSSITYQVTTKEYNRTNLIGRNNSSRYLNIAISEVEDYNAEATFYIGIYL